MLANKLEKTYFSVSEINNLAKNNLESTFLNIAIQGEVSKITNHTSGHWYFTIKDELSSLDCTMFSSYNKGKANLIVGNKIIAIGKLTIYPASGKYQLNCTDYELADGLGKLQAAFNELYKKLKDEGLFLDIYKKQIPKNIKKIAVITAINSAAAKDILRVYENNEAYLIKLVFFDSLMQGENASKRVIECIKKANEFDFDVILIARGGGSKEDLFCFNDEALVRQIVASKIPIITGLGHEIDTHLSDLAASKYYATPTAAMQSLVYNKFDRMLDLDNLQNYFNSTIKKHLDKKEQNYLYLASKFSKKEVNFKFNSYKNNLLNKKTLFQNKLKNILKQNELILNNQKTILNNNFHKALENKERLYNIYENKINITKLKSNISSMQFSLNQYEKLAKQSFNKAILNKNQSLNDFIKSKNIIDFKIKLAKDKLENQKILLNNSFKPKFKEKYVKINNYQKILSTHQSFLESIKEYARVMKDNKGIKLSALKEGDEITLKSIDCVKIAKIIKE
ncbi:exodeoxyribonuclease VII large subunit [Campylobacter sp. 2018MI13]|uniref:exodeoxyribonuclease VII large subunit n=1 Tax=Campylobacter sp. 2018MI13 TaxID=2836737 RepID=UPI001BDA9C0E|nr:exodeoxyribonuclease VII large subunit [Campylobacter sp. 2018MI13]MBT0882433.1 exodeoxyribonuclease VII large subunit [Campylobacter sp. 2018MI13]